MLKYSNSFTLFITSKKQSTKSISTLFIQTFLLRQDIKLSFYFTNP